MKRLEKRLGALSGWGAAAVAILVWGVTFANTRMLLEDFSALEINILRFGLAWLVLWGSAAIGKCGGRPSDVSLRSAVRTSGPTECEVADCGGWRDACPTEGGEVSCSRFVFAAMGLTGVAAYQFLENCAIYYTNACNVAILVSFGPIVTAVMARLWTNDRSLSLRLVLGSLVSVLGATLVAFNGVREFDFHPLGDLMILAAVFCWGVYSLLVDHVNRLGIDSLVAVRKSFGWALLMMLPLAAWGATDLGYVALDGSCSVTLSLAANVERFASLANWTNLAFLA
jgi:drug/metabolite transporter (DMT)-like permease